MNVGGYFSSSLWPQNGVLIHGGVPSALSQKPSNRLVLLTSASFFQSVQLLDDHGPSLSHHASCLVKYEDHEILVLIGGWTGRLRTNKVFAFDLHTKLWIDLQENPQGQHRVDPPIGLSGHTATKVNSGLICIVGREGGIKTQRKFGQMFLLHFNLKDKNYWYSESPIMPKSRSGHTALLAPPVNNTCDFLIFGGRNIENMFTCGKWESSVLDELPVTYSSAKDKMLQMPQKNMTRMMGLRYHAMLILTSDYVLIHGGRHFKAISGKDVNGAFFLCHLGRKSQETWTQLLNTSIPRFGHSIVLHNETVYLIGGFSSDSAKEAAKTENLPLPENGASEINAPCQSSC